MERVTFRAEDNTFIWSKFGNLIASTDLIVEVIASKDPEVGAFVQRYGLTSVVAKVRTERKTFKKGNI